MWRLCGGVVRGAWCVVALQGWMVAVDLEAMRVDVQFLLAVGGALEDPVERCVYACVCMLAAWRVLAACCLAASARS